MVKKDRNISFFEYPVVIAAITALEKTTKLPRSVLIRFLIRKGLQAVANTPVAEIYELIYELEAEYVQKQMLQNRAGGKYSIDEEEEEEE
jgi:hypothetical protein